VTLRDWVDDLDKDPLDAVERGEKALQVGNPGALTVPSFKDTADDRPISFYRHRHRLHRDLGCRRSPDAARILKTCPADECPNGALWFARAGPGGPD